MKYIFLALIFLHGAIHLFGFAKAFNLWQIEQLNAVISKISGLVWFIVFVLFVLTGLAFLAKAQWWYWLAIVTVVISTVLIVSVWKDAKYGTIPNVIILLIALYSLSSSAFNKKVANEISTIMNQADTSKISVITQEQLDDLPYPVAKWLKVSGMIGKEKINTVWLSQKARMKMKPEQKEWNEAIDSLSAKATMNYKGTSGSGTFYFNEQGDFIKFSALRYKGNEADAQRYEWVITVKEHSIKNSIKIPTIMEATWMLENGNWTWLDLEITDIRYNTGIEIDEVNN